MSDSLNLIRERYNELCARRDAVNVQIAPIQKKLESANKKVEEAQFEANVFVKQINDIRGGQDWISMKKEIGLLAKALSGKLKAEPEAPAEEPVAQSA